MIMIELLFNYRGQRTSIQGEKGLSMKNNFKTFINELNLNSNNLRFLYNDEPINEEITLEEFLDINNLNNTIEINVIEKNEDDILSKEIICPECKQLARMSINEDTDDEYHLYVINIIL